MCADSMSTRQVLTTAVHSGLTPPATDSPKAGWWQVETQTKGLDMPLTQTAKTIGQVAQQKRGLAKLAQL